MVGQTFAQEEEGEEGTVATGGMISTHAATTRSDEKDGIAITTTSSTPPSDTTNTTAGDEPSAAAFLWIRPLHNIQVSLVGNYYYYDDPSLQRQEQEESFLILLKSLLEESLFRAMVPHFVPKSDMEQLDKAFHHHHHHNASMLTEQQDRLDMSILSQVMLEWTDTPGFSSNHDSSKKNTDQQYIFLLQANGTLGFKKFDYALLHPETILPLQEEIIGNTTTTTTTNPGIISLVEINRALKLQNFSSLEVLELSIVTDAEEGPTASPTVWQPDDDQYKKGHQQHYHPKVQPIHSAHQASKNAIRTAVIMACIISMLVLGLVLWFASIKSKQIIVSQKKEEKKKLLLLSAGRTTKGGLNDKTTTTVPDDDDDVVVV